MKTRRLVIRVAAVLVLIIVGIIMSIIGRGHTIYLDNKTLEYNGQTYKAPYKVTIYVGDEQLTKLYDKERGSTTCLGQTFTVMLESWRRRTAARRCRPTRSLFPRIWTA